MTPRRNERSRGSIYLGVAAGLFAVSGALAGGYVVTGGSEPAGIGPAAASEHEPAGAADLGAGLGAAVGGALDTTVTVKAGGQERVLRWSELGVVVDADELPHAARKASGGDALAALRGLGALPVRLDRAKALDAITHLKATIDRAPTDAYLDLEARAIHDDKPGFAIDVFASLDRIEAAARSGAAEVELASVPLPARVTKAGLGIDDISHVLGHFRTTFAVADKDRNFNLKLAASKLNGYVLEPGVEFSFNAVVGDRTEKEGYKIAHVITKGEMVDGLAGGTCQISTTLFGASFFAGIDITKTTPHSRPSTYVPLGMDSTVVWPNVDLKMKNPYDFPVVIHYRVARGEAVVEILGKKRPWDKIAFEREVLEETPFQSEKREDEGLPIGVQTYDQEGFPGYKLTRFRKFYRNGKVVKTDKWKVEYKPVTEYVRVGTNLDPLAAVPDVKPHHGPKKPGNGNGRIEQ